jgi:hypothetical protein
VKEGGEMIKGSVARVEGGIATVREAGRREVGYKIDSRSEDREFVVLTRRGRHWVLRVCPTISGFIVRRVLVKWGRDDSEKRPSK